MIRFLLNAILAFVALRFAIGIARHLGGGADSRKLDDDARGRVAQPRGGGRSPKAEGLTGADRTSVIDVPYTEVAAEDAETADAGRVGSEEARP